MSLYRGNSLSVILPCYNPDPGWEITAAEKFKDLKLALPACLIQPVIVNDGSTHDFEKRIIDYLNAQIPGIIWISYPENHGKGFALRCGVERSISDYYIYTDIDFPYTTDSIVAVYNDLANGADIVAGIREQEYYEKVPLKRVIISKFTKQLIRYLLNTSITDTQCGLKGFNQRGKDIFLKTTINRFLFDMEFIKIASGDKAIKLQAEIVHSRPGIKFSHMNYRALIGEMISFAWLVLFHKAKE